MVSAWGIKNGLVLGQVKTDEKSNEINAIPQLLELFEIKGCIVTIDAMGCQESPKLVNGIGVRPFRSGAHARYVHSIK